jgi:hypothetical protein
MPTVKGPTILSAGKEVPGKILSEVGGIKLPFKANNFKFKEKKENRVKELMSKGKLMFSDGSKVK